jgi:hypothetical protein
MQDSSVIDILTNFSCNRNNKLALIQSENNLNNWDSGGSLMNNFIGTDVFFEIIDPPELEYTYKLKPAKDFGAPFVS